LARREKLLTAKYAKGKATSASVIVTAAAIPTVRNAIDR